MVYTLTDPEKVRPLFGSWEETMIISCLQRVMGTLYVTDTGIPNPLWRCWETSLSSQVGPAGSWRRASGQAF